MARALGRGAPPLVIDLRGGDVAMAQEVFQANTAIASGNALKLSIQRDQSQSEVWDEVARQEEKTARVVAAEPSAAAGSAGFSGGWLSSTGTYNAIVENDTVRHEQEAYVEALLPRLERAGDGLGVVVSINGDIVAADVYGSHALFQKLARKLVDSYALEAVLARDPEATALPPTKKSALGFLSEPVELKGTEEKLSESMLRRTRECKHRALRVPRRRGWEYGGS
jgi:SOS response regulatory protein OraA/RecX